jgi:uncharacterized protein YndB with AHSA1/START domain
MTVPELRRDLTITRLLNAPRDLVFQAWTEPEHLTWFLNDSAPVPTEPIEVDLRVGGAWRLMMVVNDELRYYTGGVYREIVPAEKLVYTWGAAGGWPEIDEDSAVVTITLDEVGDQTRMTFHVAFPEDLPEERMQEWLDMGISEGWTATLGRLVTAFAGTPSRS